MITTKKIRKSREFRKLKKIGGHTVYHLEGNAYKHSLLVWKASKRLFKGDRFMQKVALLHDIGKIYASVCSGPGNWTYPYHSVRGGEVLGKFIPESDPRFITAKWYIQNHIKPLFWGSPEDAEKLKENMPAGCSIENLARLAYCDVLSSYGTEEAREKNKTLIPLLMEVGNISAKEA
jgi:hypothetical protein